MRLTGDLQKISIFFLIFLFFKCFRLREMGFLLFPVGEEWLPRFMPILSGIFWRCEIDELLTISFYTWFSILILFIWFSSKVRNLLRKCLRSTASPLCIICFHRSPPQFLLETKRFASIMDS